MFRLSLDTHKCLQSFRLIRKSADFTDCKLCKLSNRLTVLQNNCMRFSSLPQSYSEKCCGFSFLSKKLLLYGQICVDRHSFSICNLQKIFFSSSLSSEDDKPPNKTDTEHDELLTKVREDFKQELDSSLLNSTSVTSNSKLDDHLKEEKYSEIEDVEDFEKVDQSTVEPAWKPPIPLQRGLSGVFDLPELCTVLEDENAKDLCVIEIPPEAQFADHMVIVSALSRRHMRAMLARVQWIHKRKKLERDASMRVEGLQSDTWFAMDLGNIILHIFMPETREVYDLETLWTVGPKYDDRCQDTESPFLLSEADLLLMEFKTKTTEQKHK